MLKLLCLTGLNQGKEYILDQAETAIGRSVDNDICVLDTESSRQHCSVLVIAGCGVVVDNDSRNGTFVNNLRVAGRIELSDGDALKVGNTIYKVFTKSSEDNFDQLSKTLRRSPSYTEQQLESRALEMTNTVTLPKNFR